MGRFTRTPASLLLIASLASPARATTHQVAQLGNAPLLGQLDSTATLRANVTRNQRLFSTAGKRLGLNAAEYEQLRRRIASSHLAYGTIPSHLDAMTWSRNGHVYVVRDVNIPPNTQGWTIELHETGQIVDLYIPNRCGNLSVVRKAVPVVGRSLRPAQPLAAATAVPSRDTALTPLPVAPPPALPAPVPTAGPFVRQFTAPVAAGTHHANALLPILGLIAIGFLAGGHGGGTSAHPIGPPGIAPGPGLGCPTPALSR
jgi:hypothetical protein